MVIILQSGPLEILNQWFFGTNTIDQNVKAISEKWSETNLESVFVFLNMCEKKKKACTLKIHSLVSIGI